MELLWTVQRMHNSNGRTTGGRTYVGKHRICRHLMRTGNKAALLSHTPIWCFLAVSPGNCIRCLYSAQWRIKYCRRCCMHYIWLYSMLNWDWSQQRASRPAQRRRAIRLPCIATCAKGLTGCDWLITDDLWCVSYHSAPPPIFPRREVWLTP